MKRRNDYKVAMAESMELEPLGGMDKSTDTKRNGVNKFGKCVPDVYPGRAQRWSAKTNIIPFFRPFMHSYTYIIDDIF